MTSSVQRYAANSANRRSPLSGQIAEKSPVSLTWASEIIELAPAVDLMQPAAIALRGEIEGQCVAVQEVNDLDDRTRALARGHTATWADHRLPYRQCHTWERGTLYFDGGYEVIGRSSRKRLLSGHHVYLGEAQLCSNYVIDRYFGHWLIDGLALELLAAQRSLPAISPASSPVAARSRIS